MDGSEFLERVRERNKTELTRLGSEKALVATTNAALDRETVLERTAAAERRAAETFEQWEADEEADRVREAFAEAARQEREHYDRVCELGDIEPAKPDTDALHRYLRERESTVERVATGLVARPLVASRTLLQVINFFVNEAETAPADRFREIRSETDEQAETGGSLLAEICDDWEQAEDAAEDAIEAAYEEYADTLEGMGLDPKPVC